MRMYIPVSGNVGACKPQQGIKRLGQGEKNIGQ